ncbi:MULTISPECIES: adenylate/guanylate cyclase domain-containing protein [Alteromonas]|uniref:adenylate cyclase n=1 Tax=Alteromonas stellipolaris TaxID=233316 RepID=A0ABM5YHF4_9ALTE|nr:MULTISPECIES: adenylate/guanylate cyclase domain-containing protein [Alteromonas]AMJ90167.1 hypothetical protein AV940_06580 [Alteromonas sp. Mac2]ALM90832.1 Adenylate cyclase [Alteromonas stellipolaris LMG 21856]AMJ73879.1 hypothetical protein AVL57_07725 [Alteromonas stellipolaris]AMJ86308.1 hypothetical protein AV939_06735 [Alteromonas sp. Mac1]MDP2535719.1 adenylate/guanylate cyclase domain-containing protein [Alteromonas stellipolaris]
MLTHKTFHSKAAVLHTTARFFALCLLLQSPLLMAYAQDSANHIALWWNLTFHILCAFTVLYLCHKGQPSHARTLLITSYYSYIVLATLLWRGDVYIQHFLLIGCLCCVGLFSQHEQRPRLYWGLLFALTFCVIDGLFSYSLHGWQGAIRRSNSITLTLASVGLILTLHAHSRRHLHHLAVNYRHTRQLLIKATPAAKLTSAFTPPLSHVPNTPLSRFSSSASTGFSTGLMRQSFSSACVLFADIKGYQTLAPLFGEQKVIEALDAFYSQIDVLAAANKMYPVKTNGDEYMAVSELCMFPPLSASNGEQKGEQKSAHHINNGVLFALAVTATFKIFALKEGWPCQIRIGVAAGPVTAGMPRRQHGIFDVWGNTVNLASMLEQHCKGNAVTVCDSTFPHLTAETQAKFCPILIDSKIGELAAFEHRLTDTHYASNPL